MSRATAFAAGFFAGAVAIAAADAASASTVPPDFYERHGVPEPGGPATIYAQRHGIACVLELGDDLAKVGAPDCRDVPLPKPAPVRCDDAGPWYCAPPPPRKVYHASPPIIHAAGWPGTFVATGAGAGGTGIFGGGSFGGGGASAGSADVTVLASAEASAFAAASARSSASATAHASVGGEIAPVPIAGTLMLLLGALSFVAFFKLHGRT